MKIIEQFIKGKREDQRHCEDGIFAGEHFIAVIDGVTSKGNHKWCGEFSSGCHGKNVVLAALENMPRDIDCDGFFETLDRALCDGYKAEMGEDILPEFLRVCIIVYSKHYNEIWSLGDCQCMINGKHYETPKYVDTLMSDLRAFVIESAMLTEGLEENTLYTNDIGREAVVPFIKKQFAFENKEDSVFGYGVLNGHGVKTRFVNKYPVKSGDTVVLASDGYPALCDSLEKSESELVRLLETDPLCYKENRGTKGISGDNASFDDRSYIKFEV